MTRWKPLVGEKYYFVDIFYISFFYWEDDKYDNEYYNCGNCFQTQEDAERALEKLRETLIEFHKEIE